MGVSSASSVLCLAVGGGTAGVVSVVELFCLFPLTNDNLFAFAGAGALLARNLPGRGGDMCLRVSKATAGAEISLRSRALPASG